MRKTLSGVDIWHCEGGLVETKQKTGSTKAPHHALRYGPVRERGELSVRSTAHRILPVLLNSDLASQPATCPDQRLVPSSCRQDAKRTCMHTSMSSISKIWTAPTPMVRRSIKYSSDMALTFLYTKLATATGLELHDALLSSCGELYGRAPPIPLHSTRLCSIFIT